MSGRGSYGRLAEFKAETLNAFVRQHRVSNVVEYGCGDGNQLRLADYPAYVGFDISAEALSLCREIFRGDPTKSFRLLSEYAGEKADLALSLDVIYHLIEDEVFESYMKRLFDSSDRFVIIYSSNTEQQDQRIAPHVTHRKFTKWIEENVRAWKLIRHIPNKYPYSAHDNTGSFSDFYIYGLA